MRAQMVGTIVAKQRLSLTDNHKQMYRNDLWAPTARQPLLPDRDIVATNAWNEACRARLGTSLEDEE